MFGIPKEPTDNDLIGYFLKLLCIAFLTIVLCVFSWNVIVRLTDDPGPHTHEHVPPHQHFEYPEHTHELEVELD